MTDGIKHKATKDHGETGLASEWNDIHEITGNVDWEKHQILNLSLENRTDWPAGPVAGQIIFRSDYPNGFIFDGTTWKSITPGFLIVVASDGTGDYLTIQEGIDALPVEGGVVHVKTGTYVITSAIEIGVDNTTLEGDGPGTTIETIQAGIDLITNDGYDFVTIKDLFLYGGGTGKANTGIGWKGANNGSIRNVVVQNCEAVGIYIEGAYGNLITENTINDTWNFGIWLTDGGENIITNNSVFHIYEDDFGVGIEVDYETYDIINDNQICYCTQEGIYFNGSEYNNFEGNMVFDNSHTNANTYAGIMIAWRSRHNTILGNKSFDDKGTPQQKYGIRENAAADNYNILTNNVCTGNVTAEVSKSGANSIEDNNITGP